MNLKLKSILWWGFVCLLIVVLFIARSQQNNAIALTPTVLIKIVDENAFLTEQELVVRLKRNNLIFENQKMKDLNTEAIEQFIAKMHEVEKVDVYKRFAGNWEINLQIRKPYARIFNKKGESFYLDSKGFSMKTSPNFTARCLVFSGNIPDQCDSITVDEIINNRALKSSKTLDQIYRISNYVCNDPFLRAQIAQVFRNQWGEFVLIPQVGKHEILFGQAHTDASVKDKMEKLKNFYQFGLPFEGWSKYETINLKYKNQVVCRKKIIKTEE